MSILEYWNLKINKLNDIISYTNGTIKVLLIKIIAYKSHHLITRLMFAGK